MKRKNEKKFKLGSIDYRKSQKSYRQRSKIKKIKRRVKNILVVVCLLLVIAGSTYYGIDQGIIKVPQRKEKIKSEPIIDEIEKIKRENNNKGDKNELELEVERQKMLTKNNHVIEKSPIKIDDKSNIYKTKVSKNNKNNSKKQDKYSKEAIKKINVKEIAVKKSKKTVGTEYFSDAAFIGDSRTEGLKINTGLKGADVYAKKGLALDTIFKRNVFYDKKTKSKITAEEALKRNKYKKIYIMFGVNELGWPYDKVFTERYVELVRKVKKLQPDAIIYVQGIFPVTKEKSKNSIYRNDKVRRFNKLIARMTKEEKVNYLEVSEALVNKNGDLPGDASIDGVHLNKKYCLKWLEYLKAHTV